MKITSTLFIFISLSSVTIQRSNRESSSYRGAIVEYSPVLRTGKNGTLPKLNANNYVIIIEKAVIYNIDIILFPESSLSVSESDNETIARTEAASYIPDPAENIVPCDDKSRPYKESLYQISCAAQKHQIYVVINHREKVDCDAGEGCPADGFLTYNTNVAFDRKGQVVARYRKYNLYGEPGRNVTQPIPTTFETDFGVTFGTFICFDLGFETPTLNLIRDLNVTDVLFSAHWFSELPYLHAVEAQAAWAYGNDVNFLASGFNYPTTGSGGGGIYIGKDGYLKVVSETKRSNILVVAEIPKVVNGKRALNNIKEKVQVHEFTKAEINTGEEVASEEYFYKRDRLSPYTTQLIDLKQKNQTRSICDRKFCCDFKLSIDFDENVITDITNYYRYRFAIFNGVRTYDGFATGGVKICGIIYCSDDSIDSCGHMLPDDKSTITPTTFTSLEITTQSLNDQSTFFMPTTFLQSMIPLDASDFDYRWISTGKSFKYHMKLKQPVNNLLTFSIYGRNFAIDGSEVTRGFANTHSLSPIILLVIVVVSCAIY